LIDGEIQIIEAGEKVEVDDLTGRDLVAAKAAKNLGGRPKKQPETAQQGITTDNVVSTD
jgi:hypothetical protein